MVRVFRDAGYQVSRAFAEGVLHLEFDIDPTERSLAVRDSREQRAEARSVHNALHPSSVAVIGASTDPSKIGYAILTNLLRGDFTGPVYPVHPEARSVRGVRAYAIGHRHPRRGRPRRGRRPRRGHGRRTRLVLREGRQNARRGERRVRGSGAGRLRGRAAARRGGPRARHARDRAQRARRGQHRTGRPAQRHPRPGPAGPGPHRVLRPVRRAGHRDPRRGAQARPWAVDLRLGGQPRRPVGQRHAAVLADGPGHRHGAAVPGDVRQPAQVRPGGAQARPHQADRRGEERAAHRPGRGARRPTPSRSTRPASGRCSSRQASSGSRRSPSCSTPRCCWPTSRCPPVRGSRWWATPPRSGCSSPTRWWGRGCSSRANRSTSASPRHRSSSPPRSPPRSRPATPPRPTSGRRSAPAMPMRWARRFPRPATLGAVTASVAAGAGRPGPRTGARGTGGADALVAVFVPPVATPGDAYARALRETAAASGVSRQAGGRGVLRRRGRARRAGRAGPGRHPRPRVGAQLRQPRSAPRRRWRA